MAEVAGSSGASPGQLESLTWFAGLTALQTDSSRHQQRWEITLQIRRGASLAGELGTRGPLRDLRLTESDW